MDVPPPACFTPLHFTDATRFAVGGGWTIEHTQLSSGPFEAKGGIVELTGMRLARVAVTQTLLYRGRAPRDMFALIIPGFGSGTAYVNGQLMETGQCATMAAGSPLEAVTHRWHLDLSLAFDLVACRVQMEALGCFPQGLPPGTSVVSPGPTWIRRMQEGVDWLYNAVLEYSQCLSDDRVRASLSDHVLAAFANFDSAPADVDATTSSARAGRRAAVRMAREVIHARLSEPLRLSELCRHANLKIRSLEYGFREVTGLTPVAYVRSLRLNAVRRALQQAPAIRRSISEIATDYGFWHLSQFATDYRRFFGETPTQTRRRCAADVAAA